MTDNVPKYLTPEEDAICAKIVFGSVTCGEVGKIFKTLSEERRLKEEAIDDVGDYHRKLNDLKNIGEKVANYCQNVLQYYSDRPDRAVGLEGLSELISELDRQLATK